MGAAQCDARRAKFQVHLILSQRCEA